MDAAGTPARVGPRVAVVILASGNPQLLTRTLEACATPCRELGVGVVVIHCDEGTAPSLLTVFPEVKFVATTTGAADTERRAIALMASGADLVIFADEQAPLDPKWVEAVGARTGLLRDGGEAGLSSWVEVLSARGVEGVLGDR